MAPKPGEDTKRCIVAEEPLDVSECAAADAEGSHGRDGDHEIQHVRSLRSAGDQPCRSGGQADGGAGRRHSGREREKHPARNRTTHARDADEATDAAPAADAAHAGSSESDCTVTTRSAIESAAGL